MGSRLCYIAIIGLVAVNLNVLGQTVPASTIHKLNDGVTKTMIPDGINPPLASRMYVYPNLCFVSVYEHITNKPTGLKSKLLRFPDLPAVEKGVDASLAATLIFKNVAESMLYRPELFEQLTSSAINELLSGVDSTTHQITRAYVKRCLPVLETWIASDNYGRIKAMPEHILRESPDAWEPTPPNYYDALEPNWSKLLPVLDIDLDAMVMEVPIRFDTTKSSDFFQQANEVYEVVTNATDNQYQIAKFWDCNPLTAHLEGHFAVESKQMTPGGHWMGITGIACEMEGTDFEETSYAYCHTALALYHGFILAWTTKYREDLIRPETYINRYIDPDWRPLLETPPFPEYTSAHSVISMAAAKVLTQRFGDNFSFKDTMELAYGLPERRFESFIKAAEEVSVSRVYGGIHYSMGVEDGMKQGELLGEFLNKMFRKD